MQAAPNASDAGQGAVQTASASGPRAALGWIAVAGLAALAYRELFELQAERSLREELEEWFFVPSSSFAPAVVVLALWLLYRRLPRLRATPARPGSGLVGGALLAGGAAIYLWATYTAAADLLVPSLMLNALACAWLWRGGAALRAVLLPVALLAFAMPAPGPLLNQAVYQLQLGTTELAGWILYALGVPHVVFGERIVRPQNTFSVIEACSGLRSMETLSIVAILMVDLFRRRGLHAWLVVLAAPFVAFALNGLRAVLLIVNPHSEIAEIHNLQGVAILLAGVVLLFLLDGVLEWSERRRPRPPAPARDGPPAPARDGPPAPARDGPPAPAADDLPEPGAPWAARGTPAVAAVLAGCIAASLWLPRWEPGGQPALALSTRFSRGLGTGRWAQKLDTDRLFLGSVGFRESFTLRYTPPDADPVVLFFGLGSRPRRARSPLSPKTALPGSGWIVEEEFTTTLEPGSQPVRASLLRSGGSRVLSYHWTQGALSWPAEAVRAFLALDRSPFRRAEEIRVVRIGTAIEGPLPEGKITAQEKLVSFYHLLRPLLDGLEKDLEKTFS